MIDRTQQCMTGPFMEAGARRLLPMIEAHRTALAGGVLELGPNLHPLVTPELSAGPITYLEVSEPCVAALRARFPSVSVIAFDLEEAWRDGHNQLSAVVGSQFGVVVMSQLLNYIDHRAVLAACGELLAPHGLVFVNNVMNHGGDWMFHDRRPQSWEEFCVDASALGFEMIEHVAEPAGVRDPNKVRHLGILRRTS